MVYEYSNQHFYHALIMGQKVFRIFIHMDIRILKGMFEQHKTYNSYPMSKFHQHRLHNICLSKCVTYIWLCGSFSTKAILAISSANVANILHSPNTNRE